MAKPAWIEIINGASGSGSTTRTLKAKAHTGRLSRSGSIKGTVSSGESDTVSLSQIGANEFISINLQSYSVTALGGVVTITGTSNSPSLKITNLSNASIISSRSLKINGTTYTWDGDSSHLIANDPGAANTYSFEISLSITENQTESSRSTSFYLSDSGSTVVKTSTISITQAAGVKTYGTEDFTLNYNIWDIPASGGTASCIYSFTIPWGWNGKTSGGGTLTQNDEHTIEFNYRDDGPDYPFDWSLDSNTGDITVASLGTNETTSSSGNIYIQATVTIQGKTIYAEDYVEQQANEVSYRLGDIELSVDDIPASGGTASVNFISGIGYTNYSSGESSTTSLFSSSDVSIDHNDVSADNLGTTVKSRTKVGTLNVIVTWNGVTEFPSLDVYQEANKIENTTYEGGEITYEDVSIGEITDGYIPASGGTATATAGDGSQSWSRTSETKINHYTSGEREELLHDFARSGTDKISPSVDSIKAVAASRGTTVGSTITLKTQTVTWIGEGGLSKSGVIVIYQEENKVEETSTEGGNVSYSDLVAGDITNGIIPASGGSATATAGKGSVVKAIESTYNVNTYTSGSVDRVLANAGSSETIEVEPSVSLISATASSKGTTISEQTVVKSQDVTWETGNLSVSDNMYIYQEANTKSISELKTNIETLNVPAEGCTYSLQEIINPLQYYVYTSGEKKEITPMWFGYEQGANSNTYNFITIEYNNISFGENDGDARSGVVTITVNTIDEDGIVDYSSIIDVDISFIQEKKLKKPSMVIDHNEFYANGNLTFDNNTTIAILKVTDNDNAGWSIHPFSQGAWLLIDSSSLVISGTGASVISVTVKVNETLEDRNGNISLYSGEDQVDSVSVTQLAISKINL